MLPAAARMRHREIFQQTVRSGRRASRPSMMVHLTVASTELVPATPQVGFVVNRRVGTAVVRNRLRRQLRHLIRGRLARIQGATPGADVVVRVSPRAVGLSSAELASDFDRALTAVLAAGPAR